MASTSKSGTAEARCAGQERQRAKRRAWDQIKAVLEKAFRKEFNGDTVDVSHGYGNNIHIVVVSRKFQGKRDRIRQDWLWTIVDRTNLTDDEKGLISLLYPVSPDEIV